MVGLAVAGTTAALAAYAAARFQRRKRKDPAELERIRRLNVNRRGRITAGRILDSIEREEAAPGSRLVFYRYEAAGVTYEAAQDVSPFSAVNDVRCLTGQTASIKYDPKRPTNSIIACEEWCGVAKPGPTPGSETPQAQKASETVG